MPGAVYKRRAIGRGWVYVSFGGVRHHKPASEETDDDEKGAASAVYTAESEPLPKCPSEPGK